MVEENPPERFRTAETCHAGGLGDGLAGFECGAGEIDSDQFDIACGSGSQFGLNSRVSWRALSDARAASFFTL